MKPATDALPTAGQPLIQMTGRRVGLSQLGGTLRYGVVVFAGDRTELDILEDGEKKLIRGRTGE